MGLSLPFFFPLSKGKFSGIAQWIWQVIPTFSVGGFLAMVAVLAAEILEVLAPLVVSFILAFAAFLVVLVVFAVLVLLTVAGFLALVASLVVLGVLALLVVVGFLASVVLGVLASEASSLLGDLAF